MKRDASNGNSKRKIRHDQRRERQRARRKAYAEKWRLPLHNELGMVDVTPYVASKDIITRGRYTQEGKGFVLNDK